MNDADALQRDAAGIGALADPVRRQLYRFVCAQPGLVSRDQAADAVGIPHHQAKFHLDRLTAEGLLESEYARLTGRSGPGFYDVALRDFGLLVGAVALARLAQGVHHGSIGRSVTVR